MMTRCASELTLAADFSGSETFSAVGMIREPSLALNVAVGDLFRYRENPELKPVITHVLATRVAGRCSIKSPQIQRALAQCMAARLAMEWKITVPAIGHVRALFLVTRLEKAERSGLFDLVLQLASQPCFEALQAPDAEALERSRPSLRIF